jgi:Tfp pilus assembly protein PilF
MLGGVYEASRDKEKAEKNYKKAIEMNPASPVLHMGLASFYLRQNIVDKAKKEYGAVLQHDPNSLTALMTLGVIAESEKKNDEAKKYYEKVLKVKPDFPPAANNLAYILAENGGNVDIALNLAQKAKEQVPDDPHISDTLGWIYYKKNVPSRAIVYLQEADEKVPDQPIIKYHLGMAYYKNGNLKEAKRELSLALQKDPNFAGASQAKATLGSIK